uniref:SUN domain-containing protein n=1 Tax=Guillardia theta TaxID=55529 RepID=A0A7S4JF46_GUITH|mmetsp:Transcript_15903/g.53200  ORF Transcript_15903/g.53200 Transcript_15903/m.53200 type:complete len:1489 (+) Transcript_15903:129-4595(+)
MTTRTRGRVRWLLHLHVLLLLLDLQVNAVHVQSSASPVEPAPPHDYNETLGLKHSPYIESQDLEGFNRTDWAHDNTSKKAEMPEVKGNASSGKSFFEKFVNLVSPSVLAAPNSKDSEEEVLGKDGNGTDSDGTGGGEAHPTAQGHIIAEANSSNEVHIVNPAGDPHAVQIDMTRTESGLLDMSQVVMQDELMSVELNEPMDIDTEIFPEMISSIQPSGDCADVCTLHTCNGHGVCTLPACTCNCTGGYTGSHCSQKVAIIANFQIRPGKKPCPDNCAGQGDCLENGTCSCHRGWAGYNCSIECMGGVANPCSGHGACLPADGKCLCQDGYAGKNCTRRNVPQDINKYREMVLGEQVLGEESKTEGKDEAPEAKGASSPHSEVQGDVSAPEGKKADSGPSVSTNSSSSPSPSGVTSQDGPAGAHKDEASTANAANHTTTSAASNVTAAVNSSTSSTFASHVVRGVKISRETLRSLGVNHAAFDLGGKALASNKEARGESALLKNDRDKYWISPCKVEKGALWVVVELNEIINVNKIVLGSFEFYSSTVKDFQVLTQLVYPTDHWNLLGYFQALPSRQYQEFVVKTPMMAKFLKIRVLTHHGNEFYCTLSSIQVYGTTQWEEMGRMLDENEHHVDIVKRALVGGDSADAGKERQDQKDDLAVNVSKSLNVSKNESVSKMQNVSTKVPVARNASKGSNSTVAGNSSRVFEAQGKGAGRGGNTSEDLSKSQGEGAAAMESEQVKEVSNQTGLRENLPDPEDSNVTEHFNASESNQSSPGRTADIHEEGKENASETTSIFAKFVSLVKRKSDEGEQEGSASRQSPQARDHKQEANVPGADAESPGMAEQQQRDLSSSTRRMEGAEKAAAEAQQEQLVDSSDASTPSPVHHGTRVEAADAEWRAGDVDAERGGPADVTSSKTSFETDSVSKGNRQEASAKGVADSPQGSDGQVAGKVADGRPLEVEGGEEAGKVSAEKAQGPMTATGTREEASGSDQSQHAASSEGSCSDCSDAATEPDEKEAESASPAHSLPLRSASSNTRRVQEGPEGGDTAGEPREEDAGQGDGSVETEVGEKSKLELRESEQEDGGEGRNSSCEVLEDEGSWKNSTGLNEGDALDANQTLGDQNLSNAMGGGRELADASSPSDGEGSDATPHNKTGEQGEGQANEGEKKLADEQRKRLVDEQRRVAMGLISSPSRIGELSFFHKVPEKIKMLEINHSFLQSYMEETKKQYDESFEDMQTDVKTLQSATSDVRGELTAIATNLTERIKTLENHSALLEAKFEEQAQMMSDQLKELEALRAFNERNLLLLQTVVALLVVGIFLQQGRSRTENVSYLRRAWMKMLSSDWRYFGLIQGLLKLFGFRAAQKNSKKEITADTISFASSRTKSAALGMTRFSSFCNSSNSGSLEARDEIRRARSTVDLPFSNHNSLIESHPHPNKSRKAKKRAKTELSSSGQMLEDRSREPASSLTTQGGQNFGERRRSLSEVVAGR